jgi:hypothetical protein
MCEYYKWNLAANVLYVGKAGIVHRGALTCATRCRKGSFKVVEVAGADVMMTMMNGWLLNLNARCPWL